MTANAESPSEGQPDNTRLGGLAFVTDAPEWFLTLPAPDTGTREVATGEIVIELPASDPWKALIDRYPERVRATLDGRPVWATLEQMIKEAGQAQVRVRFERVKDEREWGYCQVCGYTLTTCICEEGPS
ncbi:MAG: hypothetical protein M3315_06365 [Actinomycetota bacterium]|nr:hypothetical protein [Actinomycetota bacterium]